MPGNERFIQLFPTLRCNRSCGFCFIRDMSDMQGEMSAAMLLALPDRLRDAGAESVDILGGEPTLHPGIETFVAELASHGFRATLSTNGTNPDILRRILRAGAGSLSVGVSLNAEAPSPALHSFIIEHRPMLKSIALTGGAIPPSACAYMGVEGIEYYYIYRDAIWKPDLDDIPSFPEYLSSYERLRAAHPAINGVHCGFLHNEVGTAYRCPAGTAKLTVMPEGSVYPCYLLARHEAYRLGDIFSDSPAGLWDHPALDFFRNFEGNRCAAGGCELHAACRGGCPAMGLIHHGDIAAPDPRCAKAR